MPTVIQKFLFFSLVCFISTVSIAQNVGIGNPAPAEKLDVNGNINLTGTIKANGVDGAANQVLMKNNSGGLQWGNIFDFKNFLTFYSSSTFTIPAGVTKIMTEIWGAGGGGNANAGGGGGGYVKAEIVVVPGDLCTVNVGFGGSSAFSATAVNGGESSVIVSGTTYYAFGGTGATYVNATRYGPGLGGSSPSLGSTTPKTCVVITGTTGGVRTKRYEQSNATTFLEMIEGGDGGTSYNYPNGGGRAAQQIYNLTTSTQVLLNYGGSDAVIPGGGGASGLMSSGSNFNGGFGAKGMVIIYY